jgi:hypothetical protein
MRALDTTNKPNIIDSRRYQIMKDNDNDKGLSVVELILYKGDKYENKGLDAVDLILYIEAVGRYAWSIHTAAERFNQSVDDVLSDIKRILVGKYGYREKASSVDQADQC